MMAQDEMTRARKLAAGAIGIDSNIDTIQRVLVMGEDLGKRWEVGHVDIPRRCEEGADARFLAWVTVYYPGAARDGQRTARLSTRSRFRDRAQRSPRPSMIVQ